MTWWVFAIGCICAAVLVLVVGLPKEEDEDSRTALSERATRLFQRATTRRLHWGEYDPRWEQPLRGVRRLMAAAFLIVVLLGFGLAAVLTWPPIALWWYGP